MKKSIAVILLGSALLLPNGNNVEASYANNEVQVSKAQCIQYIGWESEQFNFYKLHPEKNDFKGYHYKWNKDRYQQQKLENPAKPVTKPVPSEPVEKPTPTEPVTKPEPSKPAEKPTPTEPITQPAPTVPVENPTPTVPAEKPVETPQDASISAIEKAVLDLTNAERQKAGLKPLQTDSKLMNSARQKSTDMASKGYFSHTSPTYGSPFDQMKANGVTYKSAAENIAMGQRTAAEVVKGWMESPGHRQNILTPGFTHIGIGYDKNGNYWTQQFIQK
ncbi:CAP domain-containing protein [Sporosarcina sp. G11-34]|uniref:CAP domain-containing protein n=1 Tax=Sporosarcina sp. G11-34 TaxID=2849605 RepID=UPI0022A922F8|nr:CAP domain-containing protein [Sporosarcina sp. G11-34]MCZ2258246.1 hypothetical protein [Sporosarcina sp. G11-34]